MTVAYITFKTNEALVGEIINGPSGKFSDIHLRKVAFKYVYNLSITSVITKIIVKLETRGVLVYFQKPKHKEKKVTDNANVSFHSGLSSCAMVFVLFFVLPTCTVT